VSLYDELVAMSRELDQVQPKTVVLELTGDQAASIRRAMATRPPKKIRQGARNAELRRRGLR